MPKAENTRQRIIEKTATIFNTKGFSGTSMQDIMKTTGLSKGCIYGNFQSKDEVALAAFDFNHNTVTEFFKTKLATTDSSIQRLLIYPNTYRNYFRFPFLQSGCPILNTATEADDTHPQLRVKVTRALDFWQKGLENQIKRGIVRGEIKKDTNPMAVAVIMIAIIEGAFMRAKVTAKTTDLKIAMDYLEQYILNLSV